MANTDEPNGFHRIKGNFNAATERKLSYDAKLTVHDILVNNGPQSRNRNENSESDPMPPDLVIDKRLECFICHKLYHQPRILPCLHTFCSACILNLQTYPCNRPDVGSSASSHDLSHCSDGFISVEDDAKKDNLKEDQKNEAAGHRRRERSSSRRRGASEERFVLPIDKSQLIEKKMVRSSSCDERFHDLSLSVWTEPKSPRKRDSRRRNSSLLEERMFKTNRKSVVSSISFDNFNADFSFSSNSNSQESSKNNRRVILCPTCLREVEISKTLEELPRNFMLERMIAKHVLIQAGSRIHCESCIDLGKQSIENGGSNIRPGNVTAFCVDCQKSFCSLCASSHRKSNQKKWHQMVTFEQNTNIDVNVISNTNSSSSSSGEYYSISDSMTTIPESVREEPESPVFPQSDKAEPKVPKLFGNVKKLKLPNLQKFSRLFNWKQASGQSTQNTSSSDLKLKSDQNKSNHQAVKMNGLVNDAFEDRRFLKRVKDDTENVSESIKMAIHQTKESGYLQHGEKSPTKKSSQQEREHINDQGGRQLKVDPHHVIPCWKHPDEALKMFCITCELCVCRECVVLQHSDDEWQLLTRHLFQSQMEEVDQLIQQVLPRVEDVDDQLMELDEVKDKVAERSMEVRNNVNNFMDAYVDAIQKQREILLEQVTSVVSAHECKLNVARTRLKDMRSDVEQTCCFVAELLMGSSDLEILSMKKLIKRRLQGFKGHEITHSCPTDAFIRFCPTAEGQIINNFQMFGKVVDNAPCAARSILLTKGLVETNVSQKCVVTLNVCDSDGNLYTGSDVNIRAWIIANSKGSVPVNIQDKSRNGKHVMTFTPSSRGAHLLHVTVNNSTVMNSPFKFHVKQRRPSHKGAWQCCTFCHTGGRRDVSCGCGYCHAEGGYLGCVHETSGHPGAYHWSCCGQTAKESYCKAQITSILRRQVAL